MKEFDDLPLDEQNRLMVVALEDMAAAGVSTIDQAAEARGMTVGEIWSEICSDAGMDECAPWRRYPARPDRGERPSH
jgi:hypothetical protein